jgi:hypothetical protein
MRGRIRTVTVVMLIGLLALFASTQAQTPSEKWLPWPIDPARKLESRREALDQVLRQKDAGQLLTQRQVEEQLHNPIGRPIHFPPPKMKSIAREEIIELGQRSHIALGWLFKPEDGKWRFYLSGAFPVTEDGVICTAYHLVDIAGIARERKIRDCYLVAFNSKGESLRIERIVAASKTMDTCLIQVRGEMGPALPMIDTPPGGRVYCFSQPMWLNSYFSEGIVNRYYWDSEVLGKPGSLEEVAHLRMNVSCAWGSGSSGSAVLDERGNVCGMVSGVDLIGGEYIAPSPEDDSTKDKKDGEGTVQEKSSGNGSATGLQVYRAVPMRAIRALAVQQ